MRKEKEKFHSFNKNLITTNPHVPKNSNGKEKKKEKKNKHTNNNTKTKTKWELA